MGKLMAGFLFLFLDFNLNFGETVSINLLPEFVGFLCLCAGFSELCEESPRFVKLHPLCVALAIVEGILWFGNLIGLSALIDIPVFWLVISLALMIATYYVTYQVIGGIFDIEEANSFELGASKLKTVWFVLVICNALAWLMGALMLMIPAIIALVVAGIAVICFLVYFNRTKKDYFAMKDLKAKEKLHALDIAQQDTE